MTLRPALNRRIVLAKRPSGLPALAMLTLLTACQTTQPALGAPSPDLLLTHGRIYTGASSMPWAQVIGVKGDRIVFVGNDAQATAAAGTATVVDLHGAFVMPGMIDAHTHPGMVSIAGSGDEQIDIATALPTTSKADLLAALRDYARQHSNEERVMLTGWNVANFLPNGPDKRDLDAIWPHTPVLLFDNTGHSYWANSAMLKLLGVSRDSPDLTPGVSILVRDKDGEPTGWLKEFVVMKQLAPYWLRPEPEIRARLKAFLDHLAHSGVTSVFDAGNYGLEDSIYRVLAQLDRAGELPVRYFGSYHIWDPRQFDVAVSEVQRLRATYGSRHLLFNTVKIHYDGISELTTAGEFEPFATDANNRGGVIADSNRLARFFVDLDAAGIDVHLHTIGDRASDEALSAVAKARSKLGRPLHIMVTLCHLETVKPENFARFKELGVTANFTPTWFPDIASNDLTQTNLGPPRNQREFQMGTFVRAGVNVSAGTDITSSAGISSTPPLLGLQFSMTRKAYGKGAGLAGVDQPKERLTLPEAIRAYTLGGAIQQSYGTQVGTLQVGKQADLVVLEQNPFNVPPENIHEIGIKAVLMDGVLTAGRLD